MTEYVLKLDDSGDYFVTIYDLPLWTSSIEYAKIWQGYNPLRFLTKWYIAIRYKRPLSFRKVARLKANIDTSKFKAKGG